MEELCAGVYGFIGNDQQLAHIIKPIHHLKTFIRSNEKRDYLKSLFKHPPRFVSHLRELEDEFQLNNIRNTNQELKLLIVEGGFAKEIRDMDKEFLISISLYARHLNIIFIYYFQTIRDILPLKFIIARRLCKIYIFKSPSFKLKDSNDYSNSIYKLLLKLNWEKGLLSDKCEKIINQFIKIEISPYVALELIRNEIHDKMNLRYFSNSQFANQRLTFMWCYKKTNQTSNPKWIISHLPLLCVEILMQYLGLCE